MCVCFCSDKLAIAIEQSDEERKFCYFLQYPSLQEVLDSKALTNDVLRYCGLYDLSAKDLNYGDLMLTYGEIFTGATKAEIKALYDEIETMLTKYINREEEELLKLAYKCLACVVLGYNI
jgi:hypothetical protein